MSPRQWWTGTRLVAGRALAEGFASRTWRTVTALLLLVGLAVALTPRLLGEQQQTYTLATVGQPRTDLAERLASAARAGDFTVALVVVDSEAAAETAVGRGEADAALTDEGPHGTLYVAVGSGSVFPAVVTQAALAADQARALAAAGLDDDRIAAIQNTPPPQREPVGQVADEARAGIGFAVGLVLYGALIIAGQTIATSVATEKSTRISEVLLAVLRPTQLLVGTVAGVGLLGLVQITALAVPALVGSVTNDDLRLPAAAGPDIALGVAWFVLGVLIYAFSFAALGTLVDKPTEVGSATLPVNILLIGSYLLAVVETGRDPSSWASVLASFFPFSAPLVMPVRWASGLVPGWQLWASMTVTAVATAVLAAAASKVYARGLARTGRRLHLRDVL